MPGGRLLLPTPPPRATATTYSVYAEEVSGSLLHLHPTHSCPSPAGVWSLPQGVRIEEGVIPRTIVYDDPQVQAHYAALVAERPEALSIRQKRGLRKQAEVLADTKQQPLPKDAPDPANLPTKDDYLAKLAKYVPAEAITVATLGFAAIKPAGDAVWWVLAAFAAANVVYLLGTALATQEATPRPRGHFYVLSVIAFALWAAAILAPVQQKLGIAAADLETWQTFILAGAAFIIPAVDSIASHIDVQGSASLPVAAPPDRGVTDRSAQ
jgi:hypothetical protein